MCIRDRVRSYWAVWLAGLAWGFSPVALQAMDWGWTNFLYLATAPLLFYLLCDLLHFRRHSPRFIGLMTSVVLTVQLTIGAEILAILVVTAVIMLAAVTVVATIMNRELVSDRLRAVGQAGLWSLPILVIFMAPLSAYAVVGAAHLPSWVYPPGLLRRTGVKAGSLVSHPIGAGAFHAHWI